MILSDMFKLTPLGSDALNQADGPLDAAKWTQVPSGPFTAVLQILGGAAHPTTTDPSPADGNIFLTNMPRDQYAKFKINSLALDRNGSAGVVLKNVYNIQIQANDAGGTAAYATVFHPTFATIFSSFSNEFNLGPNHGQNQIFTAIAIYRDGKVYIFAFLDNQLVLSVVDLAPADAGVTAPAAPMLTIDNTTSVNDTSISNFECGEAQVLNETVLSYDKALVNSFSRS